MRTRSKIVKMVRALLFFTLAFMVAYLKIVIKLPYDPRMGSWEDMYIVSNLRYIMALMFTLLGFMEIIEVIDK